LDPAIFVGRRDKMFPGGVMGVKTPPVHIQLHKGAPMENPLTPQELSQKKCKPCEGGTKPLNAVMVKGYLSQLPGWELVKDEIVKDFQFKDFYKTIAFVNAVAWIAHQEDHHPDLEVGYKTCKVRYVTHAIDGLSENDFICAAKIEKLLEAPSH
jgi:4a-hydroxytetrahydrobiopterin dehydratase